MSSLIVILVLVNLASVTSSNKVVRLHDRCKAVEPLQIGSQPVIIEFDATRLPLRFHDRTLNCPEEGPIHVESYSLEQCMTVMTLPNKHLTGPRHFTHSQEFFLGFGTYKIAEWI